MTIADTMTISAQGTSTDSASSETGHLISSDKNATARIDDTSRTYRRRSRRLRTTLDYLLQTIADKIGPTPPKFTCRCPTMERSSYPDETVSPMSVGDCVFAD